MIGPKSACKDVKTRYRVAMAAGFAAILLLTAVIMNTIAAVAGETGKLTYSVYPYLPNRLFRAYGSFMEETYGR